MSERRRPVHRLGDLLPSIASQLGLEAELRAARAISSWNRIVEELVPAAAGGSELLEVRPPTLFVTAADAATAQELRLHSHELLEAFAQAPGGQRLREIHVVVRGARSGQERRPR